MLHSNYVFTTVLELLLFA